MNIKKTILAAAVLSGAILGSSSAFAQLTIVPNDLYLGFQNSGGGGTADYIINLGANTNILAKSSVVDLSSAFSLTLFDDPSLQGTSSQIYGGVVGGANTGSPSDIYATVLRTSNIGTPAVAGSVTPAGLSRAQINTTYGTITPIHFPAAGAGYLDTTKGWETYVEPANNAATWLGNSFNPDSLFSPSVVLYEDLWTVASSSLTGTKQWVYQGYFKLDLTGASPKLTFSSTNVTASLVQPVIISVSKSGSTVTVVSSNAVSGFNYQLQYTSSLNPTGWNSAGGSVVAGGTLVTNMDATATSSQRFYQIQAQ